MAFFKFRWPLGGDAKGRDARAGGASSQAESIDVLRRRARHRLIGAVVLVLAAVVGFPVLFDTQPRPMPVDIPIVIPDKQKAPALVVPQANGAADALHPATGSGIDADEEVVASAPVSAAPGRAPVLAAAPKPAPKSEVKAEAKPEAKSESKPAPKVEPKVEAKLEPKASKPEAKPEHKPEPKMPEPTDGGRFIVQVGAFGDANKARDVRQKLEKAGLKTYTHVIDTPDGKRIRVRVGPFATKAEAEKASGRVKSLSLSANILTL